MCKVGFCGKTYCGVLIGLLNTCVMVGYGMGVVILETQCDNGCYNAIELLACVLGGPVLLYITGYFLAWLAYQRGRKKTPGCGFCCVMFWAVLLIALLGVMAWHAYLMINHHTYEYSDIYGGMVAGNVAYAALLCLVLCNVMPKEEKQGLRQDFNHLNDTEPSASEQSASQQSV
eukprot:215899_1